MNHLSKCEKKFDDEFQDYWNSIYEEIVDFSVVKKIIETAKALGSNRKAHVFCQRAVQDLTDSMISTNGRMGVETVDAINFAIRSGMAKQLRMTIAHYAANYIQLHVSPSQYKDYLITLFS